MTITASKHARAENDLYETEAWATNALLGHIGAANLHVWEPAAGNHKMADALKAHAKVSSVITSDLVTYDIEHCHGEMDFLTTESSWNGWGRAIITNPPYGKGNHTARKFVEKALQSCNGYVAMLLTAGFDSGKTRRHLFAGCPRYEMKVSLLDRISWTGEGETGTTDHAWYVWGPSTVNWIERRGGALCRYGAK